MPTAPFLWDGTSRLQPLVPIDDDGFQVPPPPLRTFRGLSAPGHRATLSACAQHPSLVTCGPALRGRSQSMPWQLKFVIFSAAALLISAQACPKTILSLDHTALPAHVWTSTHSCGKLFTQCAYSAQFCITAPTRTLVLGLFHNAQERATPHQCTCHLRFGAHTTRMPQSTGPCGQNCNIMSLLQRGMMHAWLILPSMHAMPLSAFFLRRRLVPTAAHLAVVYCPSCSSWCRHYSVPCLRLVFEHFLSIVSIPPRSCIALHVHFQFVFCERKENEKPRLSCELPLEVPM